MGHNFVMQISTNALWHDLVVRVLETAVIRSDLTSVLASKDISSMECLVWISMNVPVLLISVFLEPVETPKEATFASVLLAMSSQKEHVLMSTNVQCSRVRKMPRARIPLAVMSAVVRWI